jgi:hypothetical protein
MFLGYLICRSANTEARDEPQASPDSPSDVFERPSSNVPFFASPYPPVLVALKPILRAQETSVSLGLLMNEQNCRGFVALSEHSHSCERTLSPCSR